MKLEIQEDGKLRYTYDGGSYITSTTSVPEGFDGQIKVDDNNGRISFWIELDGEWTVLGGVFL